MHAVDLADVVLLECPRLHHRHRAGADFFGGLEDPEHAPGGIVLRVQRRQGAREPRRVPVMPAGVGAPRGLRSVGGAGRIRHRERVHVGAKRDRGAGAVTFDRHEERALQRFVLDRGDAVIRQPLGDPHAGAGSLEPTLGMLMEVVPERDEVGEDRRDFGRGDVGLIRRGGLGGLRCLHGLHLLRGGGRLLLRLHGHFDLCGLLRFFSLLGLLRCHLLGHHGALLRYG